MQHGSNDQNLARKHAVPSKRPGTNRELSANTRAEKYYGLLDDNIAMKTNQNLLDGELKKMQTRLTRINDMIRKER